VAAIRTEIGARRFAETMVASPGALVGDSVTGKTFRIPTITPRKVGGACVFLVDDRCSIHAVAPFGCAYFDMHMDEEVYAPRSRWYLVKIMASPAYHAERAKLPLKENGDE
jgi:Fe-S-cluster containining protein